MERAIKVFSFFCNGQINDLLHAFIELSIDKISSWANVYAVFITIVGGILSTRKLGHLWRTRHLRKVWGIKDKDYVVVVCSELEDPEKRQMVEPREFIYNFKYGDVDAYFEVVATLLRLFPKIRLRVLSAGEAQNTRIDLAAHRILIGGPDYNNLVGKVLKKGITQFRYRSPYVEEASKEFPKEIVLYDTVDDNEFCEHTDEKDYGYLERIRNPNNPKKHIILIGGCHTIGVTGAVKAFSMANSEHGEIPDVVVKNAKIVARRINAKSEFSILLSVERVGQTISVPIVAEEKIRVKPS